MAQSLKIGDIVRITDASTGYGGTIGVYKGKTKSLGTFGVLCRVQLGPYYIALVTSCERVDEHVT